MGMFGMALNLSGQLNWPTSRERPDSGGKKKPTSPLSQVRRVKKRDGLCYPSIFVICLWPLSLSDNPSGIFLGLGLSCPFFSGWLCPALRFLRLCSSGLWFLSVCLSSVTSSWDLGMFVSTILFWEHPWYWIKASSKDQRFKDLTLQTLSRLSQRKLFFRTWILGIEKSDCQKCHLASI